MNYIKIISGLHELNEYKIHQELKKYMNKTLFFRDKNSVILYSETIPPIKEIELLYFPELDLNKKYEFKIRLNPTKRCISTGKKVGIYNDELSSWINRKFKESGIISNNYYMFDEGNIILNKYNNMTIRSVFLYGILKISDIELFKTALENGIGGAKGLGWGMLLIKEKI